MNQMTINCQLRNKKQAVFKAINFSDKSLELGTNSNIKVPIKGTAIRKTNKFDTSTHEMFNINTLQDLNLCPSAQKAIALSY